MILFIRLQQILKIPDAFIYTLSFQNAAFISELKNA